MRTSSLILFLFCICAMSSVAQINYPNSKKIEHTDAYFGINVPDPYRWLEDDQSAETGQWVEQQNRLTFGILDQIPYRNRMRKQLTDFWNYEKISSPARHGYFYYYFKNNGLQKQSVMYRRNYSSWTEEEFIDPNKFSADGTVSLSGTDFSKDGSMLALSISDGGSDWKTIVLYDVRNKKYVDTIRNAKFGAVAWKGTDTVFYSTYDRAKGSTELSSKNQFHKLMRHVIGQPQESDKLIFGGEANPYRYIAGYFTDNEEMLIISAAKHTKKNDIYLMSSATDVNPAVCITSGISATSSVIEEREGKLYIVTDHNAPNRKLVSVYTRQPQHQNWIDVIPQKEYPVSFSTGGNYIWSVSTEDVRNKVRKYDYYGHFIGEVKLPGQGTIGNFGSRTQDSLIFFTYTNAITPSSIYKFDISSGASELFAAPKLKFNPADFETKQVFYTSKDGTKIPMTISYRKGTPLNGTTPTILYGYGGFNSALYPSFSTSVAYWLKLGGIYAVANLRGGGEYGNKWHEQGIKLKKQNVFDDFYAASEYLKKEKYTNADNLAIMGGSNGGLLVGAAMTQHPEMCKVALPAVGVMDMLRYHKFTAGAGWAYDYGTSEDNLEMFEYLKGYSPLHNLKKACYPATMVTTADHDDRVVPAHSFKFAATLQENQDCQSPALIRIDVRAGHGAGKSTEQVINETTDKFAFTLFNMGIKEVDDDMIMTR